MQSIQRQKILVVDDDLRLRDLLKRYLSEQGFAVDTVADAPAMDRQLQRVRYDLMVLDLMLPGEDGLAICRRLRSSENGPNVTFFCSAVGAPGKAAGAWRRRTAWIRATSSRGLKGLAR